MKFRHLYTPNTLIVISIKPELFYGRNGFSSDDYRLNVINIELLEDLIKKVKGITIKLPNGYIDEDFTAGMDALMRKYPHPEGVGVKFKVLDESMDVFLSSNEKVDAKPFCKELRQFIHDDSAIVLE